MPSNISSDANNTVEKGSSQLPILLVVQKSDHVGQENVIGLLTTKEYTELCDSIFHGVSVKQYFLIHSEVSWISFESAHEAPVVQCHIKLPWKREK